MRKKLRWVLQYYSGFKIAVVFLIAAVFVSVFIFLNAITGLFDISESQKVYRNSTLQNSVYYMPSNDLDADASSNTSLNISFLSELSGVKDVVYMRSLAVIDRNDPNPEDPVVYNMNFYPETAANAFHFAPLEGKWLTDFDGTEKEEGYLPVVISGYWFRDVHIGDTIEMQTTNLANPIQVKVVGKILGSSLYVPQFGVSMLSPTTQNMVSSLNNLLFAREEDMEALYGLDMCTMSYGCFLRWEDTASEVEKKSIMDYLSNHGGVATYDDIMQNTDTSFWDSCRYALAIPLILLIVTWMAFVSLFFIILNVKSKDLRVYFICGFSKRGALISFFLSMVLVVTIPCLLLALIFYQFPMLSTGTVLETLILGGELNDIAVFSLVVVLGYLTLCWMVALGFSYQLFRNQSVFEYYRRNYD